MALVLAFCCAAQSADLTAFGLQLDPQSGAEGARVGLVSPGSPSELAGLRRGDVIVAIDGLALLGYADSARMAAERLHALSPDRGVRLRVIRDGAPEELALQPRTLTWSTRASHAAGFVDAVEFAPLSATLGEYFGADRGVLVVRAPQSGTLRDGDVLLDIEGQPVVDVTDAVRRLASYRSGDRFSVAILRKREPLTLDVTVPR